MGHFSGSSARIFAIRAHRKVNAVGGIDLSDPDPQPRSVLKLLPLFRLRRCVTFDPPVLWMNFLVSSRHLQSEKAELPAFSCEEIGLPLLRCYMCGDLMEGRVDNVGGLNLGRSLDEPCHGFQHFGVSIGVVRF
jgi:hypothetical protein